MKSNNQIDKMSLGLQKSVKYAIGAMIVAFFLFFFILLYLKPNAISLKNIGLVFLMAIIGGLGTFTMSVVIHIMVNVMKELKSFKSNN